MSKSLADVLAASTVRPSVTYRATLGGGRQYVAEVERLSREHDDLVKKAVADHEAALERASQEAQPMGSSETVPPEAPLPPRVDEIRARMKELLDLMAEWEGDVTITATISDGEWAQWRLAHPARTGDQPGAREDAVITSGWCDSDALVDDLARYVTAWNGDNLADGDFDRLGLTRPDKKNIAKAVVGLYETGDGLGELRSALSAHLTNVNSSPSPSA